MKSAKIDGPNNSPVPLKFYKHCFPKMPLGNKKILEISKGRGLLGRSERSLSLAAPQGNAARLCDRSALSPAGSCPSGNVIREGASRDVSSAPPPPSPFWFSFPLSALFPFPFSAMCSDPPLLRLAEPEGVPHKWGAC